MVADSRVVLRVTGTISEDDELAGNNTEISARMCQPPKAGVGDCDRCPWSWDSDTEPDGPVQTPSQEVAEVMSIHTSRCILGEVLVRRGPTDAELPATVPAS